MYHQLKFQNFDSFEPLKSSPHFYLPQNNDPSPNGAQTAKLRRPRAARLVSNGLLKRVGPEELLEEAVSTSEQPRQEIEVKAPKQTNKLVSEKPTSVFFWEKCCDVT